MQQLRVLLTWPFSIVWLCITKIRNFFYDRAILPGVSFPLPVICVGNLAVGGTGKTPMINYLTEFYCNAGIQVAILSRGYGRRTRGFLLADDNASAESIGDEPLLFYKRWKKQAVIAVGEDRVAAVRELIRRFPKLGLILMDDGFQHRAIKPSATILLTTFSKPFYADYLLPAGNLRESRGAAARATMVVVTKSPDHLSETVRQQIAGRIRQYSGVSPEIHFSSISYGEPVSFGEQKALWRSKVILVTGIANAKPLVDYLSASGIEVVLHFEKPDHHAYKPADLEEIKIAYQNKDECVIVTTEKDYVKLAATRFEPFTREMPFFYIPLRFSFSKEKENFEAALLKLTTKSEITD